MSNYLNNKFLINFLSIIIIFLLDRVSKFYVISQTEEILSSNLFTSKFLNISLIWNEGIAFGLLSFDHEHFYNFLTILITIVVIVIFIMIWKNEGLKRYSLIMILGGALGNLYDRVFYGYVIDFIDFDFGFYNFPVFNFADVFIFLGLFIFVFIKK